LRAARPLRYWKPVLTTEPDERTNADGARPRDEATGAVEPRRVFLETYGCQMNVADSELVSGILRRAGYERTADPGNADVLLVNTCAIRENAEERVLGRLSDLLRHKTERPGVQLGLLGCVATHQRERLLDRAPYLDVIVGPDGYRDLPELLRQDDEPQLELRLDRGETYAGLAPDLAAGPRAFLTVMRGCDKFCTFCVVPFTRGRERSVPADAVLEQVRAAVDAGKREVVFLGQTVNAYRADDVDFAELLRRTARIDGLERIRFTSPHPSDVSDALIEVFATEAKVMPYLHLPLQSASNRVLEAMRRDYTIEAYQRLLERVRAAIPGIAVSTDVIVGFPGEDESDYAATESFLREARYDFAYLFMYSSREGTRAHRLPETVCDEEKRRRVGQLIALQETIGLERNRAYVGRDVEILVEGPAKRPPSHAAGKSPTFKTTIFPADDVAPGSLVRVRVERATTHTLIGRAVA
jgi:tRNA-2-methylthio-N6-dimethylallyladenosine synthase